MDVLDLILYDWRDGVFLLAYSVAESVSLLFFWRLFALDLASIRYLLPISLIEASEMCYFFDVYLLMILDISILFFSSILTEENLSFKYCL